jgi:hypothetical protein
MILNWLLNSVSFIITFTVVICTFSFSQCGKHKPQKVNVLKLLKVIFLQALDVKVIMLIDNIEIKIEGNDTVIIANDNTTIGYATMDTNLGELTYIFVHPSFRRRGLGTTLVLEAEKASGQSLKPAGPISPLGHLFFQKPLNR